MARCRRLSIEGYPTAVSHQDAVGRHVALAGHLDAAVQVVEFTD
jgi:hypothetical protein